MATVPRYRFDSRLTPVGSPLNPGTVEDWSYDALLVSEGHFKLPNGAWSGGGPFYVWRTGARHKGKYVLAPWTDFGVDLSPVTLLGVGDPAVYRSGPLLAGLAGFTPPSYSAQRSAVSPLYARGWNATAPGRPQADLGVGLGELARDGVPVPGGALFRGRLLTVPLRQLPRILFNRIRDFRRLGGEYLNAEFGWRPFVRDLRKTYELYRTLDSELARLIRENGKIARRSARLRNDKSVTPTVISNGHGFWGVSGAPSGSPYRSANTTLTAVRTVTDQVWFSAAYRYWIPDPGNWLWNARAVAALYGVLPTPEAVWNLLPWSWLIDWVGNFGEVLGSTVSIGAVDNLVCLRSFLMRKETDVTVATAVCNVSASDPALAPGNVWGNHSHTFQSVKWTESKVRVVGGNPFSAVLEPLELTPRQLGILAALGLTRV